MVEPVCPKIQGFDEVEWRGEKFKLKQKYLDYEAYQEDRDPLATNEAARVEPFERIANPPNAGAVNVTLSD